MPFNCLFKNIYLLRWRIFRLLKIQLPTSFLVLSVWLSSACNYRFMYKSTQGWKSQRCLMFMFGFFSSKQEHLWWFFTLKQQNRFYESFFLPGWNNPYSLLHYNTESLRTKLVITAKSSEREVDERIWTYMCNRIHIKLLLEANCLKLGGRGGNYKTTHIRENYFTDIGKVQSN